MPQLATRAAWHARHIASGLGHAIAQGPVAASGAAAGLGPETLILRRSNLQADLVLEAAEAACAPPSSAATAALALALARPLAPPLANEAESRAEACRHRAPTRSTDGRAAARCAPRRPTGAADAPGRWWPRTSPGTIRFPLLHGDNATVPWLPALPRGLRPRTFLAHRDERWGWRGTALALAHV